MLTQLSTRDLLTTAEAGAILRMSSVSIRDLIAEGRLRAVRVRPKGRLLLDRADVEQALREARPEVGDASGDGVGTAQAAGAGAGGS
jgi:excisionase family DNA binding protein